MNLWIVSESQTAFDRGRCVQMSNRSDVFEADVSCEARRGSTFSPQSRQLCPTPGGICGTPLSLTFPNEVVNALLRCTHGTPCRHIWPTPPAVTLLDQQLRRGMGPPRNCYSLLVKSTSLNVFLGRPLGWVPFFRSPESNPLGIEPSGIQFTFTEFSFGGNHIGTH